MVGFQVAICRETDDLEIPQALVAMFLAQVMGLASAGLEVVISGVHPAFLMAPLAMGMVWATAMVWVMAMASATAVVLGLTDLQTEALEAMPALRMARRVQKMAWDLMD